MKTLQLFCICLFISGFAYSQARLHMVKVGDDGVSCSMYELHDKNGKKVDVPAEVAHVFECSGNILSLSPLSDMLVYDMYNPTDHRLEIKLYDLVTQKIYPLSSCSMESDGLSNIAWAPSGKMIMFVEIDQKKYESKARIFVVDLEKMRMGKTLHFDAHVNYACDGPCKTFAGRDFWFKGPHIIQYRTHLQADKEAGRVVTIHLR
jgi:hypothetical protein